MSNSKILEQIIESRRSIFPKDYTNEKIPNLILKNILKSGYFAPNHRKTKPWLFTLFQNSEKIKLAEELSLIYKETTPPEKFIEKKYIDITSKIKKADAIISISTSFSGLVPEWEEIAATAMAVQNMYLTCTANHIGCYWSTPYMKDYLGKFLGLEKHQKCFGLFYMGMI